MPRTTLLISRPECAEAGFGVGAALHAAHSGIAACDGEQADLERGVLGRRRPGRRRGRWRRGPRSAARSAPTPRGRARRAGTRRVPVARARSHVWIVMSLVCSVRYCAGGHDVGAEVHGGVLRGVPPGVGGGGGEPVPLGHEVVADRLEVGLRPGRSRTRSGASGSSAARRRRGRRGRGWSTRSRGSGRPSR